jgi:hypothetical protein
VIELIAIYFGIRIFAFSMEYLFTVELFGTAVPIEELLLLLVWPALVVTLYETCIDDGK